MKLYIISGTSGAGKSIALNALEDIGFYCIDNLPISLIAAFARELAGFGKIRNWQGGCEFMGWGILSVPASI